jgi:hypothetical protein
MYRSISAVHFKNRHKLTRSVHKNSQNSRNPICVIFTPVNVSIRHSKYGLRHGAMRWPRVAFQRKRSIGRIKTFSASSQSPVKPGINRELATNSYFAKSTEAVVPSHSNRILHTFPLCSNTMRKFSTGLPPFVVFIGTRSRSSFSPG